MCLHVLPWFCWRNTFVLVSSSKMLAQGLLEVPEALSGVWGHNCFYSDTWRLFSFGGGRWCSPGGSVVKNPPAMQETWVPWVGKIPWRMKWQLTPVFLSGKSHGQSSLVGYSPWGRKRIGQNLVTKQQYFPFSPWFSHPCGWQSFHVYAWPGSSVTQPNANLGAAVSLLCIRD